MQYQCSINAVSMQYQCSINVVFNVVEDFDVFEVESKVPTTHFSWP